MSALVRTLTVTVIGIIVTIALSSCLTGGRRPISEGDWVDGSARARPLTTQRVLDDRGHLVSVRLHGTIHAYRTWIDEATDEERALPPYRDLAIIIDEEFRRGDKNLDPHSEITLRFRKLSQIYAGPRIEDGDAFEIGTAESTDRFRLETGFLRDARYFDVAAKVEVPLGVIETQLAAGDLSGRIGAIEPFLLTAAQSSVLRAFCDDVKRLGEFDAFSSSGSEKFGGKSETDSRRQRSWVAPAGIIWGTRYQEESELDRSLVTLVVTYPGPRRGEIDRPTSSWFEYPERPSDEPLVTRMTGREGTAVFRRPDPKREDETTATRLAGLVARTVQSAFGFDRPPEVHTVLFPIESFRGCRFTLRTPLGQGVAVGIPAVDGRIDERHAATFAWLLTHELTEGLLMFPYLGADCRLYRNDRRNRWIGDGAAEFLATRVCDLARREGISLPPPHNDVLRIGSSLRRGRSSVSLSDWRVILTRNDASDREVRQSAIEQDPRTRFLRYVAAEYLFDTWHDHASQRLSEDAFPLFVRWLRQFENGPTYEELTSWLSKTSGLDVAELAESVNLKAVLRYHVDKWRAMGWPLPARALPEL